ncbi:MAG: HAMP domain-containing histidine kinase [Planctomycetes bacterium]|nr:HAMP domain-containing histidine kinase [Planctomycetota bacterium]
MTPPPPASDEEARLLRRGLLACAAAHDLANALTVASAQCTLLLRTAPLPAGARSQVEALDEALLRAMSLTRRILHRRPRPSRPVEVDAALAAWGSDLRRAAAPATLEVEVAAGGGRARVDGDDLLRALGNLVRNAGAAAGSGGAVVVRSSREAGEVVIAVEDTGPGVRREVLARLFTPFVSGRPGGTGLGLAGARALLAEHGGEVRHVPGGPRTRFEVRLPAAPAPADGRVVGSRPEDGAGRSGAPAVSCSVHEHGP